MKTNMEDIDKLIKETLTEQEAKFYNELGEQGLIGMLKGVFIGKNKWILIVMNIISLAGVGVFIYSIIRFLNTDDTNMLLKWASLGFLCLMFSSMIKIFVWLQMDKNALLREIKRLELQILSLSGRMSE